MTAFDDRDKGFENKFAHDEELTFKATALCNRMLGLWAAEKMGKSGDEAKAYAHGIVEAEFEEDGQEGIALKLLDDMIRAGVEVTAKEIRKEVARLLPIAMSHVMGVKA